MNIMNKLTLRHLWENKRRTIVTIVGTIISVAMIMAVATLAVSFMDMMKRYTIANDGEWHVQYKQVDENQVDIIMEDDNTESVILSREKGFALLENDQSDRKPYLHIKEYSPEVFEYFSLELVKGRLPASENEIVLSTEVVEKGKVDYQLGDQLSLDVGQRVMDDEEAGMMTLGQYDSLQMGEITEKLHHTSRETYTVVGFIAPPTWVPSWSPAFSSIVYLDKSMVTTESPVNASVVLKKVNRSIYENASELADKMKMENPDEGVSFHSELLRYYGFTNNDRLANTLYSLSAIIMSVIMVGSVALIYNSFAISVSERSRHLGMLSSVGATKKQKRNSVFFEGAVIGAISIPIGLVAGVLGIGVTFLLLNSFIDVDDVLGMNQELKTVVTPISILIAVLVSSVTIFISTYMPARKASKVTAIDAIRQSADIKLTRKGVKTSPIVRKLFGMEAEIGLKNLKRNKRKYQITVFSLVISIVLFLVVSFFTTSLEKGLELSQGGYDYDIQAYVWGSDQENIDSMYVAMNGMEDVTTVNRVTEMQLASMVEREFLSEPLQEMVSNNKDHLEDGKYRYNVNMVALNEENMETYVTENGIDINSLTSSEGIQAILVDTIRYQDYETGVFVETKSVQTNVGEEFQLYFDDWDNEKKDYLGDMTIAAITDKAPMGVYTGNTGEITVVVTDDVLSTMLEKEERINWNTYFYLNSSDPVKTHEELQELSGNMGIYNVYQSRQRDEQMILFLSVFIYGFITLITVISIANIFNTISTSIALRKREFAMLQSVGMTPKSFTKMINFESIFYGIKSLLYGLPISIAIMYAIWRSMMYTFHYRFELPWVDLLIVVIAVFLIVSAAMLYSISKVRKENIIETLKQENI
ncbi:ABC transporter permease [Evansella sp. AB-rgal1]|uniref:ABC transporter permease n=1 Tax=Evansella sp. AB-rgal1 TaxID=3242696 RepID=UPI00359D4817